MRKKYTHLFFDLDNTLWDFETNSWYAMQETFRILQLEKSGVDFDDFFKTYSKHNHDLWTAYRKKEVTKKELTRQRFQLTFDSFTINNLDALAMNDLYLQEMPKQSHLIEGAKEILDYTKSKGYRLFIITNGFKEVQHEKLKRAGLAAYFEKVFISEEIKTPKPGREIFEHAIKSSNAKKKNSLMIGDDWDVDICGATNFGIDAVYFNRLKRPVDNSVGDSKIIESLSELRLVL
ncbi:YjjG family noncanonical pyrimidine nucleotidase [uncultured Draconibacterium sp.]|uniref:YjjG family noncanonical pyrimidine nucleotidase n=1 Tax=uncultured Draconibacterium sp. TaxID=1573823 RepID=UPI0029C88FE4|nr:YjjG family noncanonical pyrimidine nucleotidase [uncultured Draconibacterium sp.]